MKKYYFNDGKAQYGPFTVEELKAKGIDRNTPIWYEGLQEWTKAGDVSEISGYFPPSISYSNPPPISTKPRIKKGIYTVLYVIIAIVVLGFAYVFIHDFILSERLRVREETEQNLMEGSLELKAEEPSITTTKAPDNKEAEKEEAAKILQERENALKHQINENFQQYFKAKVVSANVHAFGGMSEVFVEVKNLTAYNAEKVIIYIEYLKENGEQWKAERMTVPLAAWETITVQAPGSHRGDRARASVEVVESKELGLREGYGAE